jgi:hypothetical protein
MLVRYPAVRVPDSFEAWVDRLRAIACMTLDRGRCTMKSGRTKGVKGSVKEGRLAEQISIYRIEAKEQPRSNWIVFREVKPPKQVPRSPGVPAQVRRMLGYHRGVGGDYEVRPRYRKLVCPNCQQFDADKVFDAGFDRDVTLHLRDDFAESNEHLFVIGQKMLDVLRRGRVNGYEVKKVGTGGHYVVRVKLRVDSDPHVFQRERERCHECGRPFVGFADGLHEMLSQIRPPATQKTFFTTKRNCPGREGSDRDWFCTEDVVLLLKDNDIRRGRFDRLWTTEEEKIRAAKAKQGVDDDWHPPKSTIWLS